MAVVVLLIENIFFEIQFSEVQSRNSLFRKITDFFNGPNNGLLTDLFSVLFFGRGGSALTG